MTTAAKTGCKKRNEQRKDRLNFREFVDECAAANISYFRLGAWLNRSASAVSRLYINGLGRRLAELLSRIYVESGGRVDPNSFIDLDALDREIACRRNLSERLGRDYLDELVRAQAASDQREAA